MVIIMIMIMMIMMIIIVNDDDDHHQFMMFYTPEQYVVYNKLPILNSLCMFTYICHATKAFDNVNPWKLFRGY